MNAVFQAQEEERRRIAKELHDGVGQTLSALKLNYQSLSFKATSRDLAQDLKRLHTMLDNASAEVRTISHQMMPVELEQFGLVPAIEKNGIGLLNIASRIDAIKGNLNYESSPGTGTTVTIRTPIT
jgi:signal transduction histidine kinase